MWASHVAVVTAGAMYTQATDLNAAILISTPVPGFLFLQVFSLHSSCRTTFK